VAPFVAAIALSAFAMFSLELVAGQVVLPVFGGVPAVWATTLTFFTGVLFVGYLYSHALITRVSVRRGVAIHLVVAVVAVVVTFAAPTQVGGLRVEGLPDVVNVLLVLLVVAGAPGFLFSTTTPLISAWWAQVRQAESGARAPAQDRDAFWLYAASNGASFAAVLGYPFLVQPFIGLSVQRSLIGVAALVFAGLLAVVGGRAWRTAEPSPRTAGPARDGVGASGEETAPAGTRAAAAVVPAGSADAAPGWRRQVRWLAAAFVPAGLLSATTTYITTDLVSAPLLWIWPLAIYLASFVVAFSTTGRGALARVERLAPAAATLLWVTSLVGSWATAPLLFAVLSSFAVLAIAIHGRLAGDRPAERHLTRFYLVLSAGGVLATAFVAVLSPLIFSGVLEYPILIVGALVALALFPGPQGAISWVSGRQIQTLAAAAGRRLVPFAALSVVFLALGMLDRTDVGTLALPLVAGAIVITVARSYRSHALLSAMALVLLTTALASQPLLQTRTFFGVLQIWSSRGGTAHSEYSGTTRHGVQFLDDRRGIPTSYYVRAGPLGDVFTDLDKRLPGASIGVVGLGTGTIAAYERPTDSMTFFEIDQVVVDLARDPQWFSYLADAPVPPRVVKGDARLSLEAEPEGSFDMLVLDAFSSDNVPAHLLTREAMATYRRVMRPGGIIVFHVSNRSYDLAPGIVSTAVSMGLAGRQLAFEPGPNRIEVEAADASDWVIVADYADVTRFQVLGWGTPRPGPVLTDDFSDLLRMLRALRP